MVKIYLTGANSNNKELVRSIGGLISKNPFRNGKVFSNLSKYDKQEGGRETRVLALTNTTEEQIKSIGIYYEIRNNNGSFKIEVGAQFFDLKDTVELLDNDSEIPFNVTFVEALGQENEVLINQVINPNESVSLWLRRTSVPLNDDCEIDQEENENEVKIFVNVEFL